MKCPKCGYSLPRDSEFCQYCGIKLETEPVNKDVTAVPFVSCVSEIIRSESVSDEVDLQDEPSEDVFKRVPLETMKEESLFLQAYKSYLSDNPDEKRIFEKLLGSTELRNAYLEERNRNQRERDNGVRINYKQSYMDFMKILHDEYFGLSMAVTGSSPIFDEKCEEKIAASSNKKKETKSKPRYCKLCGQAIDSSTKKCTGCGKQYFKVKIKPLYAVLVVFLLLGGYVGINYFCAILAMEKQEFIKSKQFFDNILVSETVFSGKYDYVKAGVLMEEGEYIEALNAFDEVDAVPVPVSIVDSLKSKIYSVGQTAYKAGNMTRAKRYFNATSEYKRSADYLLLISCNSSSSPSWSYVKNNYSKLVELLGFEDTDKIILSNKSTAKMFLTGKWEGGSYYFEMEDNTSSYNLPHKDVDGYYSIDDGIYYVESTKYFRFSIIDEDTISVYCYKDGSTHKLYRQ